MRQKKVGAIASKSCALPLVLGTAYQAMAQYLMDRTAEVALARSAAPEFHFTRCRSPGSCTSWFETAVNGKNRFMCIVELSWTSAPDPDF